MLKNITFRFIVLFVLCTICVRGNDKNLGDSCHNTNSNEPGTCVLLKDCPKALADIKVMKHPQICGFQGAVPIVCCSGVVDSGNPVRKPGDISDKSGSCHNTNYNETGTCVLLKYCPKAIADIKVMKHPQIFGFQGAVPIVCCSGVVDSGNPVRKPGDISDKKCLEYSEVDYERKDLDSFCRYRFRQGTALIVAGGRDAEQFPHMALLGFQVRKKKEWICGGTLISEQFVLTAGHCLRSHYFGTVKYIRLGELNLARTDEEADPQDFDIIEMIRHPKYLPPSRYNDIALVKMDRPVKFNQYIRPACLHLTKQIPEDRFIATGWGLTERGGSAGADHLQEVILDVFSQEDCNSAYGHFSNIYYRRALKNGIDPETQLCAGGSKTEVRDTCQGDSGGPIQFFHEARCMYSIVGVTSVGKTCGIPGIPGIYTRVSHYIDWIEKIVWPQL